MLTSVLLAAAATSEPAATAAPAETSAPAPEEVIIADVLGEEFVENVSGISKLMQDIWEGFLDKLPLIIFAIVILILGILLSKLVVKLMSKAMDKSKLDLTVNHFVKSAVKITLYVLVFTIVLALLGVPMTSMIAVIGTAGVALSLALQSSLSNLAGGFLILTAKPFRVGSYISVSGVEGFVESINILYTKLKTYDSKAIYIPNGMASNAVLVNMNESDKRRVDHVFSISYDSDYKAAVKAIEKAINKCKKILKGGADEPFIRMSAHGASSIEITVRVWCMTDDYWDVYFDVIENVRMQFIEDGIEIPYQQIDVHMKEK